jgi:hypothetical protein
MSVSQGMTGFWLRRLPFSYPALQRARQRYTQPFIGPKAYGAKNALQWACGRGDCA